MSAWVIWLFQHTKAIWQAMVIERVRQGMGVERVRQGMGVDLAVSLQRGGPPEGST